MTRLAEKPQNVPSLRLLRKNRFFFEKEMAFFKKNLIFYQNRQLKQIFSGLRLQFFLPKSSQKLPKPGFFGQTGEEMGFSEKKLFELLQNRQPCQIFSGMRLKMVLVLQNNQ